MKLWKLSAGTACVIGKKQVKTDVAPTTAYIMLGARCRNNCRFCSQSRDSAAREDLLSRVTWPELPGNEAALAIGAAFQAGRLKRACLQVVHNEESWPTSVAALESLTRTSAIPICISSVIDTMEQARELVSRGADRICIALDAATKEIFSQVKDGKWQRRWDLLSQVAREMPGRASTHLIVGLGETEEEMIHAIFQCMNQGITVGLFAFTPVKGTAWADRPFPSIGQYRRVQIAHFLLRKGYSSTVFQYRGGSLTGINIPTSELINSLIKGTAFETSGCPDCNRPYYNERPGKIMYNYPRKLTSTEVEQAIAESGIIHTHVDGGSDTIYEMAGC
ncbi:biotin synthase [Sporomusa ovata DSM 2662]|uniref:Biotin synthase-related protein, radical SAM superfamily n=1 Tax=Sporomusa ovata TaxID=2378 RepID=A0A0U1KYD7_9FIRM|nr:radical SAM protein [Sporomusa ovata]EQB28862.1 biotin synthase-like enzyme [Sporomusa ovata DSM 2662]CQR72285.1 Biotin synthase-related protein, radical SAM superfamily [Sporomusa ovata]